MSAVRGGGRPGRGTYVGLFLVTLSTLMLEIALTRIFSVTMWYHFAFVAISVALFGTTAGALVVHLLPERFPLERTPQLLRRYALLFAVATALCFAIQLQVPFSPELSAGGVLSLVAISVLVSVPFICSGVVVCLALTRFPGRVSRLYAVDLIGAGLGCVLLVALFSWLDGPSLVILIAAFAATGAAAFATDDPAGGRAARAPAAVAAALTAFALVNTAGYETGDQLLALRWSKGERDGGYAYERWNAFSRLTVDGRPDDFHLAFQSLVIDSTAGTAMNRWDGDLASTDGVRRGVQNLAHHVRPDRDVLVVGMGGGSDVLSALEFEQRSVTGVEINGDIIGLTNDTYADYTGHLRDRPGVRIVNDDARSYLNRTDEEFGIIQISLIDTWAATSAGAFALTENGLYTTEAWDTFLDRLDPDGILSVTRYYQDTEVDGERVDPVETYRTIALASQVLVDRGIDEPRGNLLVYAAPSGYPEVELVNVLVSPVPFTAGDVAILDQRAAEFGFQPKLTPAVSTDPVLEALAAPGGPGPALDLVSADISPPTDDRPFFFQMADLGTFLDRGILRDHFVIRPVLVLGGLGVIVLALGAACVAVPLLVGRRRGNARPVRAELPFYTYFGGIGFGFLLVEIAQLQRLSLYLGHPTYGLAVSLFSVLLFSGLGSMAAGRILGHDAGRHRHQADELRSRPSLTVLGTLLVVVAASGYLTPVVLGATDGSTTPVRIAVAVVVLAPMAFLMGMPFAAGMEAAAARPGTPTAFLWGINGAASVCASVLAVVIALFFGISAAFWAGVLAYGVAAASLTVVELRRPVVAVEAAVDGEPALAG